MWIITDFLGIFSVSVFLPLASFRQSCCLDSSLLEGSKMAEKVARRVKLGLAC